MTSPDHAADRQEAPACADHDCARLPAEASSHDPEVLRAALIREATERRRGECLASMQAEIVQLAIDLLVRQPDIDGFFGALTKTMVEEGESHVCGVWLIDGSDERCSLWMAYVKDRLVTPQSEGWGIAENPDGTSCRVPCEALARHLFDYAPGWNRTIEYECDDPRMPEVVRDFSREQDAESTIATPLMLGNRTLGWMTVCSRRSSEPETRWWRVELIEAIARQAALALHHSRVVEQSRLEERRKAILEERNRLARDIHDNLAQGFAAILMQLQGARRELCTLTPAAAASLQTAIDLARTHLTEARRSVGTLRPNVGSGEDIGTAIKRLADLGQRTSSVPIDVVVDELPRVGDGVEREIVSIAQEALTNALRHAQARRVTIRASAVRSLGLRVSVADDGRGIARDRSTSGFGMTSMQERADKIGASLTIVTAPRSGTEVVLAWEPASLPTQVYVAG
jgi:signal transduction histidine kinase